MTAPLTPLYGKPLRQVATAGVRPGGGSNAYVGARIMAVLLTPAAAAASLILYDAASAVNPVLDMSAAALGASVFVNLSEVGGIPCAVDIWSVLTGAGAIFEIWLDRSQL